MKNNDIIICEIPDHNKTITEGKEYVVIERPEDGKVAIIDDKNKKNTYYSSRFKSK